MQKLVFSRCSGKLGTATRHQGPKTGTVWSVRENPSKSPKRPALPDAVNREGAVSRHRPFVLLANHTPFRGAKRGFPACESHPFPGRQTWFSRLALYGAEFGLLGVGSGTFPTQAGNPPQRAEQGAPGWNGWPRLLGAKKPLPGFTWQRLYGVCWKFCDSSSSGSNRYLARR